MRDVSPVRPAAGALLSRAAYLASGAERLAIATVLCLDDAEEHTSDLTFLARAEIDVVDVALLLEGLGIVATNLQNIADAYGHAEVQRRSASG